MLVSWTDSCKIIKLQSCKIINLQSCKIIKLQTCKLAKIQSCKVAKSKSHIATKLQSCIYKVANLITTKLKMWRTDRVKSYMPNCRAAYATHLETLIKVAVNLRHCQSTTWMVINCNAKACAKQKPDENSGLSTSLPVNRLNGDRLQRQHLCQKRMLRFTFLCI